jgi:broad specificity phosphatase PhoE
VLLGDGRSVSATPAGREAAAALAPRLRRYAGAPFSAFLEKRRRVEDRLAALASDRKELEAKAAGQKNPHTVALGLLKLGLPVKEALRTFDEARGAARFGPQQHQTHLAVACARARREGESMQDAAARLKRAQNLLLSRKLGHADVVRGAAKSLVSFDDLEVAAERFVKLAALLGERERIQEIAVRAAARLMSAPGSPRDVIERLDAAIPPLRGSTRAGALPMCAVVLAAATSDVAEVPKAVARLQAISRELEARNAYPGPLLPTAVAELVSYKGEPAEIADLVAETARRLMGVPELPRQWLLTPDGELAAGLAKRFAY